MPGSIHLGDEVIPHRGIVIFDGSAGDGTVVLYTADGFEGERVERGRGVPVRLGETHQGQSISRIGNAVVWLEIEDQEPLRFEETTITNPSRTHWHLQVLT